MDLGLSETCGFAIDFGYFNDRPRDLGVPKFQTNLDVNKQYTSTRHDGLFHHYLEITMNVLESEG